jgi:two-component system, OmpR family, manganese sensing sensor histidine kinase
LQTWNRDGAPLALERRLFLAYLVAFATIFVVVAVVVRFLFVGTIEKQTQARLEDVARAGIRSVIFNGPSLAIDKNDIANQQLMTREEGLQWFDAGGRLIAEQGFPPRLRTPRRLYNSVTIPILDPRTKRALGVEVATKWSDEERSDVRYLDIGLAIGTLLAICGAGAGGLVLARRAVRPVERSFKVLSEFTDNASHELRGPLTVIATNADAALRETQRDPAYDRARFETIADGARQMSRLTGDLLLLAGADRSLERELFAVDLTALLAKLSTQYRPRFDEAGIRPSFLIDSATIIYGNPDQIERVLANLLDNALRYTGRGGTVAVESRRHGADVEVIVRDTGIGIAPEDLDRIFERFWRADPVRSAESSGLGLAIARALARRHGGDVTVSSRLHNGSTFVASFPLRPPRRGSKQ